MNLREIEDLLSWHADQLLKDAPGVPATAGSLAGRQAGLPAAQQRALAGLFQLASRVRAALGGVEPRPEFLAQLKQQLLAAELVAAPRRAPAESNQQRLIWMAGL